MKLAAERRKRQKEQSHAKALEWPRDDPPSLLSGRRIEDTLGECGDEPVTKDAEKLSTGIYRCQSANCITRGQARDSVTTVIHCLFLSLLNCRTLTAVTGDSIR